MYFDGLRSIYPLRVRTYLDFVRPRSPEAAIRARIRAGTIARKASEKGAASRVYRGFIAADPDSSGRQERPDERRSRPATEEEGPREDAHSAPDFLFREEVCGGVVGRGLDEGEAGAHAEDPRGDQLGDAPAKVEMNRTERAMIPSPTRTGSLTPTRSESRPATGERMA